MLGFIAQDVESLFPEIVDESETMKGLTYTEVYPGRDRRHPGAFRGTKRHHTGTGAKEHQNRIAGAGSCRVEEYHWRLGGQTRKLTRARNRVTIREKGSFISFYIDARAIPANSTAVTKERQQGSTKIRDHIESAV